MISLACKTDQNMKLALFDCQVSSIQMHVLEVHTLYLAAYQTD